jgi:putative secretion ATPase (PEP-CTERM system associated)
MYERFYRLRERPFALTPDPDYLYPSRVHREALSYLRYGIESHAGFVVITGEIGSGKTTLLQTLVRGLDSHTTVARVMNTLLDPRELLESAMIDLGLDPDGKSKPAMLKQFAEFLVAERAAGRIVLLVVDEAQNLSLAALEEVRMLSNLETEKSKLIQIVLIGQPELRDKLNRPELEQLRQRISVSYHLHPLDADETAQYINHRLARAAISTPLEFPRGATDLIHERSRGVPRVINVIADATLVFGYGEERGDIDAALVRDVIKDLDETGVLGNPTSVVQAPVNLTAAAAASEQSQVASGFGRTDAGTGGARDMDPFRPAQVVSTSEDRQRQAALEERERLLVQREHDMASRERELAEQRRVLAEQYRILRSQPAETAVAEPVKPKPAWPPANAVALTGTAAGAAPAIDRRRRPAFRGTQPKRRTFWARVKQTLLGTAEPILEDSL